MSVITLAGAALLTVFELAFYDAGISLFSRGAPSWMIWLLVCVGVLLSVISSLFIQADTFPLKYPEKNSKFTGISELLCAIVLLLTFVIQLMRLGNSSDHLTWLWLNTSETLTAAVRMLHISVFLAIVASLYFLFSIITEKSRALLAMVFCLWVFAYLLRIYYDMSVLIVDPVRKLTITALCSILLFMCAEIRMIVGKPSPRIFVCFGLIALFFCGISGISKLVMSFTGFTGFSVQTVYDSFEVAFALYVLSRLLAFAKDKTEVRQAALVTEGTKELSDSTGAAIGNMNEENVTDSCGESTGSSDDDREENA